MRRLLGRIALTCAMLAGAAVVPAGSASATAAPKVRDPVGLGLVGLLPTADPTQENLDAAQLKAAADHAERAAAP